MIREIMHEGVLLAIVIPHNYSKPGITFCTSNDLSQQLAYMEHPAGHVIIPHVHNEIRREVHYTKEVLIVRRGKLRADFYTDEQSYVESCILEAGDVILLANGGHGFEILEDVQMIEVKQGPYAGEADKTRFAGVMSSELKIKS